MGIITNALRYGLMKDFVDGSQDNNYYIFGSTLTDEGSSVNSEYSNRLFLEKTIFGKKVEANNIVYMIRKVFWQPGIVYTQYDDSVDISESDFFVISEPDSESGEYHVYKCLFNNYGAPSTDKPTYTDSLALRNYVLNTADGYVWKYMYSVSSGDARFYSTRTLFPVIFDNDVIQSAVQSIDTINVINADLNFGYETVEGTIESIANNNNASGFRNIFLTTSLFNPTRGYYVGYTLYTTSSNGLISRKYVIRDSGVRTSDQRFFVSVEGYTAGDITNVSTTVWSCSILPSVEIIGDGTGASAITVVSNSRITGIRMLSGGQGYTRALARITMPPFGFNPDDSASGDVICELRPSLSPKSSYGQPAGHGGNPALELCSRHVQITTRLNKDDNIVLPSTNTYSKVGLVREPTFSDQPPELFDNRIRVQLTSVTQLVVGSVVTQSSTNFYGIIHSIDSINNYIYITEYRGPYFDQKTTPTFYISDNVPLDEDQPLSTIAGRVEIVSNGIQYPEYTPNTGEVLYVSDFDPIERGSDLLEQFKFIISF